MRASRVLAVVVLLDAFFGVGSCAVSFRDRSTVQALRSTATSTTSLRSNCPPLRFLAIGVYFLFATTVYILGGILIVSGKLFRLANVSLIILAAIDNILLIYTRTMPNIFLGRIIPWSAQWFPSGTVQIFIGQTVLIIVYAILLMKTRQTRIVK